MQNKHQVIKSVYAAKESMQKADDLIRNYIPFICSEVSKCISRLCTEQDDEFSIAMIAFHEAILGYERGKGAFLNYAAMLIRNRMIDFQRKELQHQENHFCYMETKEADQSAHMEATKQEIEELFTIIEDFGVSFSDVAENSPKQECTLEACAVAIRFTAENKYLLDELLRTKKLPMAQLVLGSGVERKILERHRKYILVMLLVQTNGYEIIRGYLRQVWKRREPFMKYMVMECHLSYAVVLDEEGRFLKVANRKYEVGQTVTDIIEMQISQKKKINRWLYLLTTTI